VQDAHFHVPLETEDDIARVRRALMIKGEKKNTWGKM
jgi:hypothetical protein